MSKWIAKFKCNNCGYIWEETAKPVECPKCTHLYVKWLNYDLLIKEKGEQYE